MVNLIARIWLARLVTVLCLCFDVRRMQCKLNAREAWVLMGQVPDTERSLTQAPQSIWRAESLTLFPRLFSLKLGVLSEYSNSDHFPNKLRLRVDLHSQEWLACTFFRRNSLLRLVIRMQTMIQNTLMSMWCLGPKPPATPKPPSEPPVPTNGPPLPPGKTVSYHDHWTPFKKDKGTTMANFWWKSSPI